MLCIAVFALICSASAGAGETAPGWSALGAPLAPNESLLETATAISCPTANACAAVGTFGDTSDQNQGLLMDGAGGQWTVSEATLPSDASTDAPNASLTSVSCPSAGSCTAIGSYQRYSQMEPMLVTESDGSWQPAVAAPPLPQADNGTSNPTLVKVSCSSAEWCVAVGQYKATVLTSHGTVLTTEGLILTGSGDAWTALEAPLPSDSAVAPDVALTDVSCSTADSCEVVGRYTDGSGQGQGLLLSGANGTWSPEQAPLPTNTSALSTAAIDAVACPAAAACSAAGSYSDSRDHQQALLLAQTNGQWHAKEGTLPSGTPADPGPKFKALDCSAPGDCAAVGFDFADGHQNQSLPLAVAEQDGHWQPAANPHLPANAIALSSNEQFAALDAVACLASSGCEAGGFYSDKNENTRALLVAQGSAGWGAGKEPPLPTDANSGNDNNPQAARVLGLSCGAATRCQAVGMYKGPFGFFDRALLLDNGTPSVSVPQAARARVSRRTAVVPISCHGHSACAVTLTLSRGNLSLGTVATTTRARHTKRIHVSLNAQGKNLLARTRSLRVALTVTERTMLVSAQKLRFHR